MKPEIRKNSIYVPNDDTMVEGGTYVLLPAIDSWSEHGPLTLIHWGTKTISIDWEGNDEAREAFLEHLASVLGAWPRVGSE